MLPRPRLSTCFLAAVTTTVSLYSAITKNPIHHPLPVIFEHNDGQFRNSDVSFLSRNQDGLLMLYRDRMTLSKRGAAAFEVKFTSHSASTSLVGNGRPTSRVNYLRGNKMSDWMTNIPAYDKVMYRHLYPQIDLMIYGNKGKFEADFIVAAGGAPSNIQLGVNGNLTLNANGDLLSGKGTESFWLHRPVAYQVNRATARVSVECRYELKAKHQISFSLGKYDHSRQLVIDPVLSYSTYMGGSDDEGIFGITRDAFGNLYLAGETSSLNFPVRNALQSREAGDYDCFITKFYPDARHIQYSTFLGGGNYDHCVGLAVSPSGDAFIAGITNSTDFPTRNALQPSLKGAPNGFVARLDQSGSKLVFSTYLGGGKSDYLADIAVDRKLNIYVTGFTSSLDFPITPGALQPLCDKGLFPGVCSGDAFVTKLSPRGTELLYSTYLGGSSYDGGNGLAVDFEGSAYITGQTSSTDFPVQGGYQLKLAGFANAFVTKLSPDGSKLGYSTLLGGSNYDSGSSIAIDWHGDAFVTGLSSSLDFPLFHPYQNQMMGDNDAFITRLNSAGSKLDYSTYLGGSDLDYPVRMVVNFFGTATVTGFTFSKDFPLKHPVQADYGGGFSDAFVFQFNDSGDLLYSTYLGGTSDDYGYAIYADRSGDVWTGGSTASTDFPLQDARQTRYGGGPYDAFLSRISNRPCDVTENKADAIRDAVAALRREDSITTETYKWIIDDLKLSHCDQPQP